MKIKFIIARACANALWAYYNEKHREGYLPKYKYDPPIVNEIVDCFLNGDVQSATQFNTYEEAESKIKEFGITRTRKEGNEVIIEYSGAGIYRIDKIFIHEVPLIEDIKQ